MEPRSILDDFGAEIISIVSPVSVCMLMVVLLVRGLTPNGSPLDGPAIGTLIYHEKSTDSSVERFEGALLNALVFIVAVTLVTFVLVGCFWLRCTRLIWVYMGFSGLTILAWLGGSVAVEIIQLWSIPVDAVTFGIVLYNFAVVGVLAVFFCRMPLFVTQAYLVAIGAVVAFWFTHLPEWTTWLLLVAMALYDLAAVLMPGGPLKLLVEMAMERDEDIPALIYEARSTSRGVPSGTSRGPNSVVPAGGGSLSGLPQHATRQARRQGGRRGAGGGRARVLGQPDGSSRDAVAFETASQEGDESGALLPPMEVSLEARAPPGGEALRPVDGRSDLGATQEGSRTYGQAREQEGGTAGTSDLKRGERRAEKRPADDDGTLIGAEGGKDEGQRWEDMEDDEVRPLVGRASSSAPPLGELSSVDAGAVHQQRLPGANGTPPFVFDMSDAVTQRAGGERAYMEHAVEREVGLPDAIKLGLGDFIFYSVLVGRAAMYDLMTVYACYLAIIAGLGATLALLAVYRKALPALPISIALGVTFYFLTRLVMDPFVVSLATRLVFL